MSYGMLIDTTMCVACGECSSACDKANALPEKTERKGLDANTFTYVADHGGVSVRHQCMHCNDPACASVCPVGALKKTAAGPVTYDAAKCMGCRYCMQACGFRVPTYEWTSVNPRVRKCILCADRVAAGQPTACSEACPTGATKFGDRDELIAEARARIAAEPGKYVPAIFGEHEVGGTAVLYLASVEFAKLGFPGNLPGRPLPQYTWDALKHIPAIVTAGVPLLAGIWWITNRREDVAEAEGHGHEGTAHGPKKEA